MEDAGHEAEHQDVGEQPRAPEDVAGPREVGAGRSAVHPEPDDQRDAGQRQQPADLAADLVVEHAEQAGLAAEAGGATGTAAAGDGPAGAPDRAPDQAAEGARQPADPVVAEDQVQHRVVRAPADEGPGGGRDQRHHRHPPAGAHEQDAGSRQQLADAPQPCPRPEQQVSQHQRGQDDVGLQVLGEEGDSEDGGGDQQPPRALGLQRPHERPGRRDHQEGEQRVGVVEPEHQHRDGRERHDHGRDEP